MAGILLLLVFGCWMLLVFYLARFIARRMPARWRIVARLAFFCAIIPLPLFDEILAVREFEQLCDRYATVQIDRERVRGRTLYETQNSYLTITDGWVEMTVQQSRYADVATGTVLAAETTFYANGGKFNPDISGGPMPWLIDQPCRPAVPLHLTLAALGAQRDPSGRDTRIKAAYVNKSELSANLDIFTASLSPKK